MNRNKYCQIPPTHIGTLQVLGFSHKYNRISYWKVRCICGTEETRALQALLKPTKKYWKTCKKCFYMFRDKS